MWRLGCVDIQPILPLPGGERVGVRGLELFRKSSNSRHPHPTLSLKGEGSKT
jgi:hypothetical protein